MNDVHHFRSSTPSFLISAEPPSQVEQHNKPKSLKVAKEDLWLLICFLRFFRLKVCLEYSSFMNLFYNYSNMAHF